MRQSGDGIESSLGQQGRRAPTTDLWRRWHEVFRLLPSSLIPLHLHIDEIPLLDKSGGALTTTLLKWAFGTVLDYGGMTLSAS
jgi:hypothetical protein